MSENWSKSNGISREYTSKKSCSKKPRRWIFTYWTSLALSLSNLFSAADGKKVDTPADGY
jgi:hypothetical protein